MPKWENQDENGNQNEYSRNNGIVHITEMQAWWLITVWCSALNLQKRKSRRIAFFYWQLIFKPIKLLLQIVIT